MELCGGLIGTWDWDIAQRKMQSTNLGEILGYHDGLLDDVEMTTAYVKQLIHPEDYPFVMTAVIAHLRGEAQHYEAEFRMQHHDGYWSWVQDIAQVVKRDADGKAQRMVGIRRNVDAAKADIETRKLSSMLFQQVAQGIFILDNQFRIQNTNPYFEKISGFSKDELVGTRFMNRERKFSMRAVATAQRVSKQILETGAFEGEVVTQRKNGDEYTAWLQINAVQDDHQRKTHYIGIISDLTERRKHEQRLSYLSNYDPLTDLPNRTFFKEHLHQFIQQHSNSQLGFAVVLINLDRFRLLNNLLGAKGADQLLKQSAGRLASLEIRSGIVARLGSDDFGILLEYPEEDPQKLKEYGLRLQQLFDAPFQIGDQEVTVTASIGVAMFPLHGKQIDTLFYYAESAIKEAKRMSGNTMHFATMRRGITPLDGMGLEIAL